MLDHFWDPTNGGLFTTADDAEALVVRQKDLMDNATPSANSTAAVALLRLAALTGEQRYANHAEQILRLLGTRAAQGAVGVLERPAAVDLQVNGITEVAVVGDRPDLLAVVRERWRPIGRAGVGRAVRLAAVGAPHRRSRLRVPVVHLPATSRHPRPPARPTRRSLRPRDES